MWFLLFELRLWMSERSHFHLQEVIDACLKGSSQGSFVHINVDPKMNSKWIRSHVHHSLMSQAVWVWEERLTGLLSALKPSEYPRLCQLLNQLHPERLTFYSPVLYLDTWMFRVTMKEEVFNQQKGFGANTWNWRCCDFIWTYPDPLTLAGTQVSWPLSPY